MKTPLIERLLGPNYRTTVNGWISTAFVLWGVWQLIPESERYDLSKVGPVLLGAIFKLWQDTQLKDRQVSGTPATGQIVGVAGEEPRKVEPPKP